MFDRKLSQLKTDESCHVGIFQLPYLCRDGFAGLGIPCCEIVARFAVFVSCNNGDSSAEKNILRKRVRVD